MIGFFYILHAVVSILVIAVVLFQDGKTGGLVSVADSSQSVFGAKGASSFLTKLTSVLAIIFLVLSFGIAKEGASNEKSIASDHAPPATQSSTGTEVTPATTGETGEKPSIEVTGEEADKVKSVDIIKDPAQIPDELKNLGGAKNPEKKDQEKPQDKKDQKNDEQQKPEEKKDN